MTFSNNFVNMCMNFILTDPDPVFFRVGFRSSFSSRSDPVPSFLEIRIRLISTRFRNLVSDWKMPVIIILGGGWTVTMWQWMTLMLYVIFVWDISSAKLDYFFGFDIFRHFNECQTDLQIKYSLFVAHKRFRYFEKCVSSFCIWFESRKTNSWFFNYMVKFQKKEIFPS